MASTLTQFFSSIFSPRPQRKIAIIGLDGSGGMELLRRLCGGAIKEVKDQRSWAIVHTATDYWLRCDFVLAEVGFAAKPAYFHWMATQYCDADGIIWIIDATDTDRLLESKLEMGICRKGGKFGQGLEQPGVRPDAPWLVLMNFKKIPLVGHSPIYLLFLVLVR